LVADALALPPGSTITGQPVPLVAVVATAPDRQRQIEAVHAYWRLTEAVGECHFCLERHQRLARLRAGTGESAGLRTAQAAAVAQLRDAEVQVTTAQHDLAEILLLSPDTPLPLPNDQPLIGPYRTLFAELFAGKNSPVRARMLDQTLPLRSRAVESHAAALLAAEDTLDAAIELQASGQDHLASVLVALDAHVRQQRAFLAAVCRYNHDIADYALIVVSPQTTPELLVGTLIKRNRPTGQPVTPLPTMATLPATYQPPIAGPAQPTVANWPTRAARPGVGADQNPQVVSPARVKGSPPIESPAVVVPPNPPRSNEPEEPHLARPQKSAIPLVPDKPEGTVSPATGAKAKDDPTTHTSQKPISGNAPPPPSAQEAKPGPNMNARRPSMTPAQRTVQLTVALYQDRDLPILAGQPVGVFAGETPASQSHAGETPLLRLIDCVRAVPASNREKTIETYWVVRQTAAQYQSLVEQIRWLEALGTTIFAQNPPSPTAMLKLRTARLTAEAEKADAVAEWTEAMLQLAGAAGLETEKTLPQATTVPFVGHFPLASPSPDRSWSRRRLEATIPRRELAIIDRATAVVEADVLRAAVTADFLAGRSSLERVLSGIEAQTCETSAFLRAVTDYNQAIARYATVTRSANIEAERLVAALMVE